MKKYLVKSKNCNKEARKNVPYKQQIFEAENAAQAIVEANNKNGNEWYVVGVYEEVWHI